MQNTTNSTLSFLILGIKKIKTHCFLVTYILSSANAFNLDQSKIFSCGKELNKKINHKLGSSVVTCMYRCIFLKKKYLTAQNIDRDSSLFTLWSSNSMTSHNCTRRKHTHNHA